MTRRMLWPAIFAVALIGVAYLAVFPAHTYFAQQNDLNATRTQLAIIRATNDTLNARVTALGSDDEIERLAREKYGLICRNEDAYAILPGRYGGTQNYGAVGLTPNSAIEDSRSWLARFGDRLRFWQP